ncbi:MAG: hypothetical protein R2857_01405 [Vampirovibrionales bacterium]
MCHAENRERFNRDASRVSNTLRVAAKPSKLFGKKALWIPLPRLPFDQPPENLRAIRPCNRAQRYNSREEAQRAASQRSTLRQGQPGSSAVRSVRRDGSFGETPSVDYNAPGVARSVEYQRRVNGPSAASADHVKGDGMTIVGSDGEGGYYDLEGPIDRKIRD